MIIIFSSHSIDNKVPTSPLLSNYPYDKTVQYFSQVFMISCVKSGVVSRVAVEQRQLVQSEHALWPNFVISVIDVLKKVDQQKIVRLFFSSTPK